MHGEQWRATDYFMDFHCKGGACRNSCCEGWEIAVCMQDYFKLVGMDCPDELHHRIECAFRVPEEPSPERYRMISPNWLGHCPLHDSDGLCMIHRHCGEDSLPEICRVYPRSLKLVDGEEHACCSASCEAVVELLMRERPLELVSVEMAARPELSETEPEDFPEKSRACMALVQDRRRPLRERIASVFDELTGKKVEIRPEERSEGLRQLMQALGALRAESVSLQRFGEIAFARYAGDDAPLHYARDAEQMQALYPHWQEWFENLLANHFFYESLPAVDARLCEAQAAPGVCMLYAAMRVLSAAYLTQHPAREDFADVLAGVMRLAEHSAFYFNACVLLEKPESLLAL